MHLMLRHANAAVAEGWSGLESAPDSAIRWN